MLILAHRGASRTHPENTLRAFKHAIDHGADGIEFDVHCSKDGEIIVIHDETLERTTNGNGEVQNQFYRDLTKLDAGKGEIIPTLAQTLSLIETEAKKSHALLINIELKGVGTGEAAGHMLRDFPCSHTLLISSFSKTELAAFAKNNHTLPLALIAEKEKEIDWNLLEEKRYFSLHLKASCITPEIIKRAHAQKKKLFAWTVNDTSLAKQLKELSVDGIFTDIPEELAKHHF